MELIHVKPNPGGLYRILGNSGYDLYSACYEHIDNSFHKNVECTFHETFTKKKDGSVVAFCFCDNGKSMDSEKADNYFGIGNSSTPDGFSELGNYGAGAKTSSFSIGRKIELYTKISGGILEKRVQTLETASNDYGVEKFCESEISDEEKEFFYSSIKNKEHGTLVVVSDLFKIPTSWKKTMVDRYKKAYSKILLKNPNKHLYLEGEEVHPLNYFGGYTNGGNQMMDNFDCEKLDSGIITVKGSRIEWSSYFLKKTLEHPAESYDIPISPQNSGLWIFRNDRCVGFGVKVEGISGIGDGHMNKMRLEINISGDADKLFGSTYNKMIKDDKGIDKEFIAKLKSATEDSRSRVRREEDKERTEKEEARDNEILEILNRSLEKSKLGKRVKKENNEKNDKSEEDTDTEAKTEHRKNKRYYPKLYGGYSLTYNLDSDDDLISYELIDGKYYVELNGNHSYYTSFLKRFSSVELAAFINYVMSSTIGIKMFSEQIDEEYGNGDGRLSSTMNGCFQYIILAREKCLHAMFDKQPDLSFLDNEADEPKFGSNCIGKYISYEEINDLKFAESSFD